MTSNKNVSASVRQRLLNKSRKEKRPFNEVLQYYAMERFLYRLSQSDRSKQFILKGALLLRVWHCSQYRPTMDIDMLGKTSNTPENITSLIREILQYNVIPDGIIFNSNSIKTENITEKAEYEGIRAIFTATLGTAKINMQIDIGFGDSVYPKPIKNILPCILNFPAPSLYCYSKESAIAEKFEAIIKLGLLNSRIKDFYDIWILSRQFDFSLSTLSKAVDKTFKQRGTTISEPIAAFSEEFVSSRQSMWKAFRKRLRQDHLPESFHEIVTGILVFLRPFIDNYTVNMQWTPKGKWSKNFIS